MNNEYEVKIITHTPAGNSVTTVVNTVHIDVAISFLENYKEVVEMEY